MLSPEQYIRWRMRDQAAWYKAKTVILEGRLRLRLRLRRLRSTGIGIGGLGTFLAAIGLELWIAVTTAVVAALTTYLEYMQLESTLLHYNQASADLETIRRWWIALLDEERLQSSNVNRLVEQSERVMNSESAGWAQDMHDAIRNSAASRSGRTTSGPRPTGRGRRRHLAVAGTARLQIMPARCGPPAADAPAPRPESRQSPPLLWLLTR